MRRNTMNANTTNTLRKEVYRRDGYRCAICDATEGLQLHHIKPRGKGGADHPMNLITLCWRCHAAVHGSMMGDEYAAAAAYSSPIMEPCTAAWQRQHSVIRFIGWSAPPLPRGLMWCSCNPSVASQMAQR